MANETNESMTNIPPLTPSAENAVSSPPPTPPEPAPEAAVPPVISTESTVPLADSTPIVTNSPLETTQSITPALPETTSTVVHTNAPTTEASKTPAKASFDIKPKRRNPIPIVVGLLLFLGVVGTGAYFVAKPGNLADNRSSAKEPDPCAGLSGNNLKTCQQSEGVPVTYKTFSPYSSFNPSTYKTFSPYSSFNPSTVTPKTTPGVGQFGYNYTTGQPATTADWSNKNVQIAGTYIAPNGQRFLINDPNTSNAALKYANDNPGVLDGKIGASGSNLSSDGVNLKTIQWPTTTGTPGQTWVPPGTGCGDGVNDAVECNQWHWTTCLNKGTGVNGVGCDVKKTTNDNPGGDPDPTPTTPNSPICTNIKVYKGTTQVTPSTLLPGDTVTIAVVGTGNPTQARFRVNGEQITGDTDANPNWTITTTKNASQEYYVSYTIPTNIVTFLFEGETFAAGAWH